DGPLEEQVQNQVRVFSDRSFDQSEQAAPQASGHHFGEHVGAELRIDCAEQMRLHCGLENRSDEVEMLGVEAAQGFAAFITGLESDEFALEKKCFEEVLVGTLDLKLTLDEGAQALQRRKVGAVRTPGFIDHRAEAFEHRRVEQILFVGEVK